MKKTLLLAIIMLPEILLAQNNIPSVYSKNINTNVSIDNEINNINKLIIVVDSINFKHAFASWEKVKDSLKRRNDTLNGLKSKRQNPIISFYGAATVAAGTDFLSTLTSSGQLNAIVNPFSNFYVGVGANLLFANPGSPVKKDSIDINSLMFPETGRFGALISLLNKFSLNSPASTGEIRNHYIVPQFSFAYRKVLIDSPSINFKVLNYNFGLKYELDALTKDSDNVSLTVMPYFNLFNIPDEDVKNFDKLVNDTLFTNANKHAEINAYGIKTTLQYKSFLFFFDIRHNMKTSQLSDDDPFKGTRVNVGFSTIFNISLNKK